MTGFDFENFDEKEKQIANIILQEIKDTIEGGLTSRNLVSFRNTYVINAQDSLDASYPMYVHFNIISEMIKIVSVKVSFWIDPFRAYSTAVPSGGGDTTVSGGGSTSGSKTTPSGGGNTSGSDQINHRHGLIEPSPGPWTLYQTSEHTHSTPNHTHPSHTHSTPNHQHATPDHAHAITFGIYEEDNSPTIKFYVSENEGVSYNDTFFGGYDTKKSDLEITSLLTGVGSKLIKFTSDLRARLSVQIEIKLDIKAR